MECSASHQVWTHIRSRRPLQHGTEDRWLKRLGLRRHGGTSQTTEGLTSVRSILRPLCAARSRSWVLSLLSIKTNISTLTPRWNMHKITHTLVWWCCIQVCNSHPAHTSPWQTLAHQCTYCNIACSQATCLKTTQPYPDSEETQVEQHTVSSIMQYFIYFISCTMVNYQSRYITLKS